MIVSLEIGGREDVLKEVGSRGRWREGRSFYHTRVIEMCEGEIIEEREQTTPEAEGNTFDGGGRDKKTRNFIHGFSFLKELREGHGTTDKSSVVRVREK